MNIKKVGVVGCGLMGHGIAQASAQSGYDVVVREADQGALDKGLGKIEKQLARAVEKGKLEQSDADFRLRTIDVISRVQQAYWELVFALRDQQNQLENLNLSRENLRNVEAQIAVGAKAPLERAEVQTELANRESALLVSVQNVSIAENNLKQLIHCW